MKLRPLIGRLSILTKQIQVERLQLNWAQSEYIDEVERQFERYQRVRIIVLKARQLGISTVTEACAYSLSFVHDHYQSLVVAHEEKASQHLLSMTNLYWKTDPFRALYTPKYLSRNNISWNETGSSIKISTARNARAGRSMTIHFLHASEVGFWDNPSTTMLGLRQTIPNTDNTFIALESTAHGQGNYFHQQWNAAMDGETEFVPLFFPWWRHPEYLASVIGLPYVNLGRVTPEEKALRALGLSDDRLAWRRWAITNLAGNDVGLFMQEYPATPEEAFVATGRNVYPKSHLDECYEPMEGLQGRLLRDGSRVKFLPDPAGPLKIFRTPSPDRDWGKYLVGADPTETIGGDYGCGQVINRRTLEQVAVFRFRMDPGSFAEEMAKLGAYYNMATIAPEKEGPGGVVIGKLLGMEYPNIYHHTKIDKTPGRATGDTWGWATTAQTKHLAIGWLLKVIVDHDVRIHDKKTYQEVRDYVSKEDGTYGPADENGNDDTVMALAIAIVCHALESPIRAYGDENIGGMGLRLPDEEQVDDGSAEDRQPSWANWSEGQ